MPAKNRATTLRPSPGRQSLAAAGDPCRAESRSLATCLQSRHRGCTLCPLRAVARNGAIFRAEDLTNEEFCEGLKGGDFVDDFDACVSDECPAQCRGQAHETMQCSLRSDGCDFSATRDETTREHTLELVAEALCQDDPGWTDTDGDACSWYEENDDPGCPRFGADDGGDENCCHCKRLPWEHEVNKARVKDENWSHLGYLPGNDSASMRLIDDDWIGWVALQEPKGDVGRVGGKTPPSPSTVSTGEITPDEIQTQVDAIDDKLYGADGELKPELELGELEDAIETTQELKTLLKEHGGEQYKDDIVDLEDMEDEGMSIDCERMHRSRILLLVCYDFLSLGRHRGQG